MTDAATVFDKELDRLFTEIDRYLAIVEFLRAEGREPGWRSELVAARLEKAVSPVRPLSFDVGPH